MRRGGSLLLALAMLFAAAGFAFGAAQAKDGADALRQHAVLYLETPLSVQDAQALLSQENEAAAVVWGEFADREVLDPDLGRRIQADVLFFCGSPELALPQALLGAGDEEGCIIGEAAAWELFGSTKVAGDTVRIGRGERTIRAVMREPERGIIVTGSLRDIAGDDADGTPYLNRITVGIEEAAEADAFLMRNALDGKLLRFDYLRSPAWLSELIPGKWSDFSGWKENYRRKRQDFKLIMQVHKNSAELCYENRCWALAGDTALQVVCVWVAVVIFRGMGKRA